MSDYWDVRAAEGRERKERLRSFGGFAYALLVDTRLGLFAVDPEDNSVTSYLLHQGTFGEHELALARAYLSGGPVLVVGSHIGAHVVGISRHAEHVTAIEANPETYKLLQANVRLNNCTNVTTHNLAAGEGAGHISFVLNRENSGGSKRMPITQHVHYFYDNPEVTKIEMVSLDALIGPKSFDFILMDIEGSEYFALKGMQNILSRAGAIAVEFLPHHLTDVAGVSPSQFVETLIDHFSWLYIPEERVIVPRQRIAAKVQAMFDAGHGYDLIVFSKSIPGALGMPENDITLLQSQEPTHETTQEGNPHAE